MSKVSLVGVSADDKEQLLGQLFRHIDVLDFEVEGGVMFTRIIIEGRVFTLVGDLQEALKTFLGGKADQVVQ